MRYLKRRSRFYDSLTPLCTKDLGEDVAATPASLAFTVAWPLPEVVRVAEEDRLGTARLDDGSECGLLRVLAGAGVLNALALRGPARLQNQAVLSADMLDDLELAGDKVTGLFGRSTTVEVGVDVARGEVDDLADGADIGADPGRNDIGSCDGAGVAGAADLGLDVDDEVVELGDRAESVEQSLIADNDEIDKIPLSPRLEGGDLFSHIGGAIVTANLSDEDASNHLDTVSCAGSADIRQRVAVSRVDTDPIDARLLDGADVSQDLGGVLAFAVLLVRGVGDTELLAAGAQGSRGGR